MKVKIGKYDLLKEIEDVIKESVKESCNELNEKYKDDEKELSRMKNEFYRDVSNLKKSMMRILKTNTSVMNDKEVKNYLQEEEPVDEQLEKDVLSLKKELVDVVNRIERERVENVSQTVEKIKQKEKIFLKEINDATVNMESHIQSTDGELQREKENLVIETKENIQMLHDSEKTLKTSLKQLKHFRSDSKQLVEDMKSARVALQILDKNKKRSREEMVDSSFLDNSIVGTTKKKKQF